MVTEFKPPVLDLFRRATTELVGQIGRALDHALKASDNVNRDRFHAIAITFGHTILGVDQRTLDGVRVHEHVHVRQYERWGPFFLPAYLTCSAWLWLRGGHPYLDNPFEVEAFQKDGSGRR